MSGHFKQVCKHGTLQGQCRCPAPDKAERLVACGHECVEQLDARIKRLTGDRLSLLHYVLRLLADAQPGDLFTVPGSIHAMVMDEPSLRAVVEGVEA